MAYPKPLSQKSIDKMFKDWNPETVSVLHRYFKAFADLYGSIQLKDAWKVFKKFEPKIHKKQFIEFSSIVRREDVPYYIYEIDELYCDERRLDTERFIVHKDLVMHGYGKLRNVYDLHEAQLDKPYYSKSDLLTVAAHRYHDTELRDFVDNMTFTKCSQKGKTFAQAVFITKDEQFDLDYYKSEATRKKIREKADKPFSEKFMSRIVLMTEFSDNPIISITHFLENNDYEFESEKQAESFFHLLQDFMNNSHLWSNCGFTPIELFAMQPQQMPKAISLGPGIQKAIREGQIDRDEIIRKLKEMGVDVVD
ncbi:MAG: hypothetical protein E7493_02020 [Ruminococcus albus]|nr:hypothetical protein [Ruminococcus albus]